MTNYTCLLCNSQNVVKNIMDLQFFWKNVNKQLKSADFFTEMWKFQKKIIKQKFSIFIQMWQHTFIFVVKQPNGRKSHANIHGLLLTAKCQPYLSKRQFFYILFVTSHFWILWKKPQRNYMGRRQIRKNWKTSTKSQNFYHNTDRKV